MGGGPEEGRERNGEEREKALASCIMILNQDVSILNCKINQQCLPLTFKSTSLPVGPSGSDRDVVRRGI